MAAPSTTHRHRGPEPWSYVSFDVAYVEQIERVLRSPQFYNAPRGNPSREVLGVSYAIEDPRDRVVRRMSRRSNLVFNFAEALWYLSGTSRLEMIAFYAPSIAKYSADKQRLHGSAYGPRIFEFGGAGIDQWASVLRTLADDPDSKRAFIQIFAPEELLFHGNIDVACTIGTQYFVREGRLHSATFMRANDAYRGVVSDVFSFTFLQELLAAELGLELGTYHHFVGTYHVYDVDLKLIDRLLADARLVSLDPFPRIPTGDNWGHIRTVLELEQRLRRGYLELSAGGVAALDLPQYWRDVVGLLALHARKERSGIVDHELLDALPPLFGAMVRNCWRIPAVEVVCHE